MNSRVTIGVVVAVVLIGGLLLLSSRKAAAPTPYTTPTVTQQATSPTSAANTTTTGQPSTTSASPSTTATAEANTVTLTANGFSPATLTIKAGDKVTWINKSGAAATVNSDPHPTHTNYPELNLGQFSDGESLSLTFPKAGTYGYHNHFNPTQKGTIIVQ